MGIVKQSKAAKQPIADGKTRLLAQTDRLVTAVIDLRDRPTSEPHPPRSHPHGQITCVAGGKTYFFIENGKHHLQSWDLFTVPGGVPPSV